MTYQIKIKGVLDARWSDRFGGLTITSKGGETTISGPIMDQAALHGLLMQIRDLGLPLLSVKRFEPENKQKENPE
ncbi:MAG: hypothetical protein GY805_28725 [Chloroflexi bacterium]|nr:hypothetical protein [Chloroflexota bacterium]